MVHSTLASYVEVGCIVCAIVEQPTMRRAGIFLPNETAIKKLEKSTAEIENYALHSNGNRHCFGGGPRFYGQ